MVGSYSHFTGMDPKIRELYKTTQTADAWMRREFGFIHYPNEEEICLLTGLNSQDPLNPQTEGSTLYPKQNGKLAAIQLFWQFNSEYLGGGGMRNFTIIIIIIATTNKIN